jgi:predicted esterase
MLLGVPLLLFLFLLPKTPISPVGIIYLSGYFLIVTGLLLAPWHSGRLFAFTLVGITIVFAAIAVRLISPPAGTQVNVMTLPSHSGPRLLNRIFDEQDVVLFGAQVAPYLGAISPAEKDSLDRTFSQTFKEMKRRGGTPLSPFLTTYLYQQTPEEFDVVIAEPTSGTPPKTGIIFLHGFGGNFTLQCWLVAAAGDQIDAITVCPSTDPSGAWWNAKGQSILQETFMYVRQRGVERIYLAGLSNGAIGASRLADQYKNDLNGMILISGADPNATMTELPVLLLHGKHDERIPVSMMEQYASHAGPTAAYHLFEGDHFVLLKQANILQEVIIDWLRQQESVSP